MDKKVKIISKEDKFFIDARDRTEELLLQERCTMELNEHILKFLNERVKGNT